MYYNIKKMIYIERDVNFMAKYYNIGEFAKLINKSPDTLRRWDKEGKLKPSYITSGKHRM